MRVLLVNSFYEPNLVGGAEHSVRILGESLAGLGYDVHVLSGDGVDAFRSEQRGGVFVHRTYSRFFRPTVFSGSYPRIPRLLAFGLGIWNPRAARHLDQVISAFGPDVIHTNCLYGLSPSLWRMAHLRGIPVVHTLRDFALMDPLGVLDHSYGVFVRAHRLYSRWMVRKYVDALTAPSDSLIALHHGGGVALGLSAVKIPNCVSTDPDAVEVFEEKMRRSGSPMKFLFAGRLSDHKGVGVLIRALSRVRSHDLELHVCGVGPLQGEVLRAADRDSRIVYHGELGPNELAQVYRECDVLVAPSEWEAFGRVVIEAFQKSMAVIGTDRGGIGEILGGGGGITVPFGNVEALSGAIEFLSMRSNVAGLLPTVRSRWDEFDCSRQVMGFLSLYEELVARAETKAKTS